jgi:hypothetical protein
MPDVFSDRLVTDVQISSFSEENNLRISTYHSFAKTAWRGLFMRDIGSQDNVTEIKCSAQWSGDESRSTCISRSLKSYKREQGNQ